MYLEIIPASDDCDMEKDKGCKITKPDKIGEEKTYIIEKSKYQKMKLKL